MDKTHSYNVDIKWTGNEGSGTDSYRSYKRDHEIIIANKPTINGSSDAAFRGDPTRHTPEDMFVASIASCHMLWYLHLCSEAGVVVIEYYDKAIGEMIETANGSGRFTSVVLQPSVVVAEASMIDKAIALHSNANQFCFIANSCNFPIEHKPNITSLASA